MLEQQLKNKRELEQELAELKKSYNKLQRTADGIGKIYFTVTELKNCGIKLENPYEIKIEPDGTIKHRFYFDNNLLPDKVEWRVVCGSSELYGNERKLPDRLKLAPRYFWHRDSITVYIKNKMNKLQSNIEMREHFIADSLERLESEYGYKLVKETEE